MSRDELISAIEDAVQRALISQTTRAQAPDREWLSVEQAAALLGYKPSYLRKRIDVPVHKMGRKRRYRRSELETFLAQAGR